MRTVLAVEPCLWQEVKSVYNGNTVDGDKDKGEAFEGRMNGSEEEARRGRWRRRKREKRKEGGKRKEHEYVPGGRSAVWQGRSHCASRLCFATPPSPPRAPLLSLSFSALLGTLRYWTDESWERRQQRHRCTKEERKSRGGAHVCKSMIIFLSVYLYPYISTHLCIYL